LISSALTAENLRLDRPLLLSRVYLSLSKMLSGANAFEISDIQEMKLKPRYQALRM
jgi:hypothetical protein